MPDADRPLPHNLDAEKALLGAILLGQSPAALSVGAEDFFLPEHRVIFSCASAMATEGVAVDLVTLSDALRTHGQVEAAGGAGYLASLVDGVPRVSNVEHYANIVREKAELRRLAHFGERLRESALETGATAERVRAMLEGEARVAQHPPESRSAIALVSAEEFLRRSSGTERPWLAEGLLPAASQTIWQGRPKVGKSHSLLQLVFDMASGLPAFGRFNVRHAVRCAFVEMEEPEALTKARYAAMLRAHQGQGPEADNLRFFTREDLHRMRLLPRELLGARVGGFISALRGEGVEFVVLIALRRFLVTGENIKDPEVAERINDALDTILNETGAAIALANHSRKQEAPTVEAQGFGSTFIAARADAIFEIARTRDGGRRRVQGEARFDAPEEFFLQRDAVGDGELIRWCEAPPDPKRAKREELSRRIAEGEAVHQAAKSLGIPYATAKRWAHDGEKAGGDGSVAQ